MLSASLVRAQNEDERIAALQGQIQALGRVIAAAQNADTKASLQGKLQRMQQEIGVLQQGQAIARRERELEQASTQSPLATLRDRLRLLDQSQAAAEAQTRDLSSQRLQVSQSRDALESQLAALRSESAPDTRLASQLEEEIYTANEHLRALALQSEAAEAEGDLAQDADRMRAELKSIDAGSRPNLRVLFESYERVRHQQKAGSRVSADAATLEQELKLAQQKLELDRQKLAKFDEELAALETQTGFFHRDPAVQRFMDSERIQKESLLVRIPFASTQVDAIKRTRVAVAARQELNDLWSSVQQEQFTSLKDAYLLRLRWPALALAGLLVLGLAISFLVLPIFYERETLFLSRRLVRYLLIALAVVVVAGFLFEDLSMVAATLGIVSAALVISLQDVCTSVCGWMVIMSGGKFRIGDRLEIDGTRGDVIDIQLVRTIMLEVGGWLGVDEPTGRTILVPNNVIFKTKIFNYSHGHPFVWGKLDVTITYATPLELARSLFERVLKEQTREAMSEARQAAATMQRRYGVEDAVYEPKVYTSVAENGVVFGLFYVAHYRKFPQARAELSQRILIELQAHPEVQLAYPTMTWHDGAAPRSSHSAPSTPYPDGARPRGNSF
ncbi:MAG TPA: mechanosensitive ion channel domain-containing protein [Opitutaceae bacterium]|jgi:small-conductance mechanosensitive channel